MEGIRRLSFCTWGTPAAAHWPTRLSHFRGDPGGGGRRCRSGGGRRRRCSRQRPRPVRQGETGKCGGHHCRLAGSEDRSPQGYGVKARNSNPRPQCVIQCCAHYVCGTRGDWRPRRRAREWRRNRIGDRNGNWKRSRTWYGRRTGNFVSADAHSILLTAAAGPIEYPRISPHRILRCRREGERKAAGFQSFAGQRVQ